VGKAATGEGATDAWAGWAGREVEAQWGEGEQPVKKNKWVVAGSASRWADWAESEEKFFSE
jgi:hypothetical protein